MESIQPLPTPALKQTDTSQNKTRRPVSFYENWNSDIRNEDRPGRVNLKRSRTFHDPPDASRSPSLVYTMSTTVPLSLRSCLNPERHIPTRSSLRHSRMIVLKQSCTGMIILSETTDWVNYTALITVPHLSFVSFPEISFGNVTWEPTRIGKRIAPRFSIRNVQISTGSTRTSTTPRKSKLVCGLCCLSWNQVL